MQVATGERRLCTAVREQRRNSHVHWYEIDARRFALHFFFSVAMMLHQAITSHAKYLTTVTYFLCSSRCCLQDECRWPGKSARASAAEPYCSETSNSRCPVGMHMSDAHMLSIPEGYCEPDSDGLSFNWNHERRPK